MTSPSTTERVGIVVPTIGGRPEYLPLALKSIREAGNAYILLVGNKGFDASKFLADGLIDQYTDEPEPGLAAKINFGFRQLPADIRFINWLGDDDLLTPGSLTAAAERLAQQKAAAERAVIMRMQEKSPEQMAAEKAAAEKAAAAARAAKAAADKAAAEKAAAAERAAAEKARAEKAAAEKAAAAAAAPPVVREKPIQYPRVPD